MKSVARRVNVRICIPWDPRLGPSEVENDLTIYPKWPNGLALPNPGDLMHFHKDYLDLPESVELYVDTVEWHLDDTPGSPYVFIHTRWRWK